MCRSEPYALHNPHRIDSRGHPATRQAARWPAITRLRSGTKTDLNSLSSNSLARNAFSQVAHRPRVRDRPSQAAVAHR